MSNYPKCVGCTKEIRYGELLINTEVYAQNLMDAHAAGFAEAVSLAERHRRIASDVPITVEHIRGLPPISTRETP